MANIELRPTKTGNKSWRVQIRRKGYPFLQKTFDTEIAARTWAAEIESGIENSKNNSTFVIPKLPLKVWIERYMQEVLPSKNNGKREIVYLNYWNKHLGNEIATDISPHVIENLANCLYEVKCRLGTKISVETRRKYIVHLNFLFNYALKVWKWTTYNPVTGVDTHRERNKANYSEARKAGFDKSDSTFVHGWKSAFLSHVNKIIEERKLSQRDVGRLSKLTLHAVQFAIKPQGNPTLRNLLKLCEGLGIKLEIS